MRTVKKNVHYCEHCKKHGLSRPAMERHERHCTLNPERACRWTVDVGGWHPEVLLSALVEAVRRRDPLNPAAIDWLRDEVEGCPACMLAALRQSGLEYHFSTRSSGPLSPLWDYGAEVERFRENERERERLA